MRLAWIAACSLAAACTGTVPVGSVSSSIIGGTTDTADPGVVLLFMTVPGQQGGSLCTGELISPHVVLSAAHCTGGEDPTVTNATWQVYTGSDFSQATAATMLPVKEAHFNPAFSINNLAGGNDVGVAILQNPITNITPLAINRTPLDTTYDGKPVRFVGYGLDNAAAQSGAGVKRQTTTTLSDHTDLLLHFTDGTHETCNGDSGGPAFMTIGAQEVIVGLTSYGDVNCDAGGYDTRVDAMLAFIDKYVQANDPSTTAAPPDMATPPRPVTPTQGGSPAPDMSSPLTPSGGTQTNPTAPAPTSPPSGSQAGAVGSSCANDGDCQSGLCGLGNGNNHICYAADANGGATGCAMSGSPVGGAPALAILALLSVAVVARRSQLRRRRVRA
jgi:V8-like Glu-specific endopeptidase